MSLFEKAVARWGTLPVWQKFVTGAAPVVSAGMIAFAVTLPSGGDATTKEPTQSPSTYTVAAGNTLAVKIDNVQPARPSTGIQSAKLVYVEQVEGGLTRLMAVYGTKNLPATIGPVRSARETDLDILRGYGKPGFAYSGATSTLLPEIRRANLVHLSHNNIPGSYQRLGPHYTPHNLYLKGREVALHDATELRLDRGDLPKGGVKDSAVHIEYPAATYDFRWGGKDYSVAMDGQQARNTDTGASRAGTVIVQHVDYKTPVHGASRSPYANTLGSGRAEVYRDGMRFDANWERSTASDRTVYTVNGDRVYPDGGQTWVVIAPR